MMAASPGAASPCSAAPDRCLPVIAAPSPHRLNQSKSAMSCPSADYLLWAPVEQSAVLRRSERKPGSSRHCSGVRGGMRVSSESSWASV